MCTGNRTGGSNPPLSVSPDAALANAGFASSVGQGCRCFGEALVPDLHRNRERRELPALVTATSCGPETFPRWARPPRRTGTTTQRFEKSKYVKTEMSLEWPVNYDRLQPVFGAAGTMGLACRVVRQTNSCLSERLFLGWQIRPIRFRSGHVESTIPPYLDDAMDFRAAGKLTVTTAV